MNKQVCPLSLSQEVIAYYTQLHKKTGRSRSSLIDEDLRKAIHAKKESASANIENLESAVEEIVYKILLNPMDHALHQVPTQQTKDNTGELAKQAARSIASIIKSRDK